MQKENQQYTQQIRALKTDSQRLSAKPENNCIMRVPGEMVYVSPAGPAVQAPENKAAEKEISE